MAHRYEKTFNSFPVAASQDLQAISDGLDVTFNSFPVAACGDIVSHSYRKLRLSILSQLQPAARGSARASVWKPFNSFPVAAHNTREVGGRANIHLSILSQLQPLGEARRLPSGSCPFNSFPVAAAPAGGDRGGQARLHFQFFPSCSVAQPKCPKCGGGELTFNSFPVAAEAPAACLLINLSSANFEVLENSPALLSDTCSVSRKPFPDSRRKEGIWTERNVV